MTRGRSSLAGPTRRPNRAHALTDTYYDDTKYILYHHLVVKPADRKSKRVRVRARFSPLRSGVVKLAMRPAGVSKASKRAQRKAKHEAGIAERRAAAEAAAAAVADLLDDLLCWDEDVAFSSRGGALSVSMRTRCPSKAEARRSSSRCAFGSGARRQACRGVGSSLRPEP